jgi:Rit1 DUSP-like domain
MNYYYCAVQDGDEARSIAQRLMTQELEGIPSHIRGHTPVCIPLSDTGLCLCSMSYILHLAATSATATAGAAGNVQQTSTAADTTIDSSSTFASNSNSSSSSSSIAVLNCSEHALPQSAAAALTAAGASHLQLLVSLNKRAQHKDYWQTDVLPRALHFITAALQQQQQCLVVCGTGTDASAAVCIVAMVALQLSSSSSSSDSSDTTTTTTTSDSTLIAASEGDSEQLNGAAQHTLQHAAERTLAAATTADGGVAASGTTSAKAVCDSSSTLDNTAIHCSDALHSSAQQQYRPLRVRQGAVSKETVRSEFLQLESWCGDARPQRRFMIELNKFFIPDTAGWVRGGVRDSLLALLNSEH